MLQRNILLAIILLFCLTARTANTFKIWGTMVHSSDNASIEYSYIRNIHEKWVIVTDSVPVISGRFEIEGETDCLTLLTIYYLDLPPVPVFVEQGEITLSLDADKFWIVSQKGTSIDAEIEMYRDYMKETDSIFHVTQKSMLEQLDDINRKANTLSSAEETDSLRFVFMHLLEDRKLQLQQYSNAKFTYVKNHTEMRIAPLLLYLLLKEEEISVNDIMDIADMIPTYTRNKQEYKILQSELLRIQETFQPKVGYPAHDFIRESLEDEHIRLSSYQEKNVVLLDFWASWCGPCLKYMPVLKDFYAKYADKGFVIIGINCDEKLNDFKTIVKRNLLPWINVHFKSGEDDLSRLYQVESIPFFILIDKSGTIVKLSHEITPEDEITIMELLR